VALAAVVLCPCPPASSKETARPQGFMKEPAWRSNAGETSKKKNDRNAPIVHKGSRTVLNVAALESRADL